MSNRATATVIPDNKRILGVLILGVSVLIAGCGAIPSGSPSEQESPVMVVLNNSGNQTQTATVWVVDGVINQHDDGILLRLRNGEVDKASPGEGVSNHNLDGDSSYVTSVEPPPDRSRLHSRLTVAPGDSNHSTVENFTIGSTIVVSVSEDDRVISLVAANCAGQALVGLEVVGYPNPPGGVFASYECK